MNSVPGELIPILLGLGLCALIFGLRALQHREKLAMIQNGMDPQVGKSAPQPYKILKWSLLLIGAGVGLFLAFIQDVRIYTDVKNNPALYFSLGSLFGGLGLFVSFLMERKALGK